MLCLHICAMSDGSKLVRNSIRSHCNHISFPDAEFDLMNLFFNANNFRDCDCHARYSFAYCEMVKSIKDRMKECINGAEAERSIGTFAFFDLEATGLPGKSTR